MKYLHVMKHTALVLAAGVIFVGCASNDQDAAYEYEESYSTTEASGAQPSTRTEVVSTKESAPPAATQQQPASQATRVEGDQWVIPLHEERVNVGKRTVDSGQVTIRKVVTTETIN